MTTVLWVLARGALDAPDQVRGRLLAGTTLGVVGNAMDPDHIAELFFAFGRVAVRNMFGGAGIYADGLMFGLIVDDVIYLKADADTFAAFEREGCRPFTYDTKRGERALKSYWRMPDRLYDEPEELAIWAKAALAAARRAAAPARGGKRIKR